MPLREGLAPAYPRFKVIASSAQSSGASKAADKGAVSRVALNFTRQPPPLSVAVFKPSTDKTDCRSGYLAESRD